jgi:ubiquinone/menaquinone biosynthesis C-methylase UbiE
MNREGAAGSWENEYAKKGHIWGGAVHHLPEIPRGKRVLELGCGNGKTSRALVERGCDVVGIDLSLSALHLCQSSVSKGEGGQILLADARSLPFADGTFFAVVALHIIGHLTKGDREQAARESVRVLCPGGTLYFTSFSREDFRAGNGRETEPGTVVRKNGIATHYFSEEDVLNLFGGLCPTGCTTRRWALTVRGLAFPRAEIAAIFTKAS